MIMLELTCFEDNHVWSVGNITTAGMPNRSTFLLHNGVYSKKSETRRGVLYKD